MTEQSIQRHMDMLATAFGADIMTLMDDKDIIEIIANPDGKLWAESLTKGKYFTDIILPPEQIANVIRLVAAFHHAVANSKNPEIAYELPGSGARFQGWLPPVASHPNFTIRKKAINIFSLDEYVKADSLTTEQAVFLRKAVNERKNIMIAGGTGSGKTTFANALLHELHDTKDRVIILEDLPELQIDIADHVKLRTCETKVMRDLVKGVLRMRPDRIIIGEVRDGAALELLKAWNTGHPGGICTIHANSPQATLSRIEDLVHEAATVVPTRLIEQAIDLIVFLNRDEQGNYKIEHIDELKGFVGGQYILEPA